MITCDEYFEIPIKSRKNILNTVDEVTVTKKETSELGNILKLLIENQSSSQNLQSSETNFKLATSPQTKRKFVDEEITEKLVQCEGKNNFYIKYCKIYSKSRYQSITRFLKACCKRI